MDRDDPEKRIADGHQFAEQKRNADLRPAPADMAFPSQTPGYRRKRTNRAIRRSLIILALLGGGLIGVVVGAGEPGAGWFGVRVLGVVLMALGGLITAVWLIKANTDARKDRALREPGTVHLLTVAATFFEGGEDPDRWELTSEMQIRLDSGRTSRGSYYATLTNMDLRRTRRRYAPDGAEIIRPRPSDGLLPHFDEWFVAGASLRCRYNPSNPDKLLVLPFAARGDRVRCDEFRGAGSDYVWFHSAT